MAQGADQLEALWVVTSERLAQKFAAEPLHDLEALRRLQERFPDTVECIVGVLSLSVVAGVVVFRTGCVDHAQYIAADERGYRTSALDAVLFACLERAKERGARYFSFGNSTIYGGRVFNESLFSYKAGFGAGAVVHECYDLPVS